MRATLRWLGFACALNALVSAGGSHAVRYLMGTWCDLVVLEPPADAVATEAAFREIARLERILSTWDPESEISALNAAGGRGPQPASRDLATVVTAANALCASTGGAFDATVGPLLHLWGFDTAAPHRPPPARDRDAADRVGCDRVEVRLDPPSVALSDGATLDLGGIGKGYAVDQALDVLRAHGVTRARLDFGSSSLGFLGRIDGGWPVIVADPDDRDTPLLSFRVDGGAVSSSGQRQRSFVSEGRRYGHVFDPRTRVPVESDLALVTVVAPSATLADGLSTALLVMGAEPGSRFVSRMPDVAAIFVRDRPRGGPIITTAGRIDQLTRESR